MAYEQDPRRSSSERRVGSTGAPATHDETDEALMTRVQADDVGAFADLYDRHVTRALRVARSSCRTDGHAEDAVQEAFLSAWRGRTSYRSDSGSCQGWLMTIVRNRALDQARRDSGGRLARFSDDDLVEDGHGTDSLHDAYVNRNEAGALRASVQRLPNPQAEVIMLAYFRGLTQSEIASRLALPLGTVKGRMRLGLSKLRTEMQHLDWAS